jgi:nicotinamide riboside kinase
MGKFISGIKLSETLHLTHQTDGVWLYDTTRGMNLSVQAKSSTEALVEALHYYQRRLTQVEQDYASLTAGVDAFVEQFIKPTED